MIPKRNPIHPGRVLAEEFLMPMDISQTRFAEHLGTSVQRINGIVKGKRDITPETAVEFADAFGTTPEFWINMQRTYDLSMALNSRDRKKVKILPEYKKSA